MPVQNMPILYKFSFFRSTEHKIFDENKAGSKDINYLCSVIIFKSF